MGRKGARLKYAGRLDGAVRTEAILAEHIAFERGLSSRRGSVRTVGGLAVTRDDELPLVHDCNLAWVDAPAATLPAMEAWWEEAFAGSPAAHRKFVFASAPWAYRRQEEFAAAGYRPGAAAILFQAGEPDCVINQEVALRRVGRDRRAFDAVRLAVLKAQYREAAQIHAAERREGGRVRRQDFLATLRGRPAGTIALHRRGSFGVVDLVGTAPAFRNKGVGVTMLCRILEESRRQGVPYLTLAVELGNPARLIYERLKYVALGELRWFLRKAPAAPRPGASTGRRSNIPK